MSDRRDQSPEQLRALLDELDRVMDEAARVRNEVTRQLDEHRTRDTPSVVPASRDYGARPPADGSDE